VRKYLYSFNYIRGIKLMTTYINLSGHASVKLLPNAPWITANNPKTRREIKVADLSNEELKEPTVAAYLTAYAIETIEGNNGEYPNPHVKQIEAGVFDEVLDDGTVITHNIGGKTVVEGLPEPVEGTIYITSYVTAQAAQRADVVSPNTIANPETGFAIGALSYIAFG
jgi:hypothetical protein